MRILVTGGAGFIGGNFVHHWFERCARLGLPEEPVVVFDKLTYAGNPHTIGEHLQAGRATLVQADIADREAVRQALQALIDEGTYQKVLDRNNIGAYAVESAMINQGTAA